MKAWITKIKSIFKKNTKSKSKIIVLCGLVVLIILGVVALLLLPKGNNSKGFYQELKKLKFKDLKESFICSDLKKSKNSLMATRKYSIIAINGEVYDIAFNRKFENGENCQKRGFDTKITSYIDNVVVGQNNKFYSVYENLAEKEMSFDYDIKDIIQKSYQFILKKDGNIYFQENPTDTTFKVKYKKSDFSGKINSIGIINSDYTENEERKIVVLTDKAVYYTKATNKEKCKEFADVKCDYVLIKDKLLTKNRKHILYVDDTILITKDGKVLYTGNYFDQ